MSNETQFSTDETMAALEALLASKASTEEFTRQFFLLNYARAKAADTELAEMLRVLAPTATLARGYSITLQADGTPLLTAAGVRPGARLITRLVDVEIASRVEE